MIYKTLSSPHLIQMPNNYPSTQEMSKRQGKLFTVYQLIPISLCTIRSLFDQLVQLVNLKQVLDPSLTYVNHY